MGTIECVQNGCTQLGPQSCCHALVCCPAVDIQ